MHKSIRQHHIAVLTSSILWLCSPGVQAEPAMPVAPPADRGPAILVPTDVTGGHVFNNNVIESLLPVVKTTKFHARPDAKTFLLETTSDTTCKSDNADVSLDKGCIIVCPQGGHVVVRTSTVEVAVPHDTVALVECIDNCSRVFNLAGHDVVVHCLKMGDSQDSSKAPDSIEIQEGLGYIDNNGQLSNLPKGCTLLDHSMIPNSAVRMEDRKHFKLAMLNPKDVLNYHQIAKQLKKDWIPAIKKIEQAADQMLARREKFQKAPVSNADNKPTAAGDEASKD